MPDTRDELHDATFRLRPGELFAIMAFWAFLAVFTAAGRLLDPRVPDLSPEFSRALVTLSFIEYTMWALLSVPILVAVNKLGRMEHSRVVRTIAFIALGMVVAIAVDTTLRAFRFELIPPSPGRSLVARSVMNLRSFEFLDDFMVYVALLAAALARDYFLKYQARLIETRELQGQLAEAQLAILRTQLDPHFLFNTLNAVSTLVDSDPRGVRRMIARLSELLRHTLEKTNEPEVTLTSELELLKRYLDIMEVRFQGGLVVKVVADPAIGDALVPNMILQPLVENAFKHGLSERNAGARINIIARRHNDDLVLTVRDNGPGPSSTAMGVGLTNTIARLSKLYGPLQSFALRKADDGAGALAEVRLPYHETPLPRELVHG